MATPRKIPIHMTAAATLQPGSIQGVNQQALRHPINAPMEIHEIKFQITTTDADRITGGGVGVKIMFGSHEVTRGFLPIWSFCKSANEFDEIVRDGFSNTVASYAVRLQRPCWIPAGVPISVQFEHRSHVSANVTARVSFSGHAVIGGTPPAKVSVPYFAAYVSKTFDTYMGEDADQSSETDLANGTDRPLLVHRLVGRIGLFNLAARSNDSDAGYHPDIGGRLLRIRMTDTAGDPIVTHFTRFASVFARDTRSWEMQYAMAPGSYLMAYLDKLASPNPTPDFGAQAFVGLCGTRLVPIAEMI